MAHFHQLSNGERISQQTIPVSGNSITVGLWGYIGFNGTELEVKSNAAGVTTTPGKIVDNSREWTIKTMVSAPATISALYSDEFGTHTWDWFQAQFGAPASAAPGLSAVSGPARAEVMAAVRRGQISGGGAAQLLEFERNGVIKGSGGGTAVISPLVFTLLQGLIQGGTRIEVMNIARPDDNPKSPHGRGAVGEQRTSFACDISAVDGDKILLKNDGANVEPTIRAVTALLRRLPPGFYKFGFPRPSTQLGGPVFPDLDVFLPAKSMAAVSSPPPGKFGKDAIPLIVNPDALSAVQTALDGNPKARFSMFFPDGFNHAHVEIISAP